MILEIASTNVCALMATKAATANKKSMSASRIPVKMELLVEISLALTNVTALQDFKARTVSTTSMTACPTLARTMESATIWSTISNALVPMEPLASFAKSTSTSVLMGPAIMEEFVSIKSVSTTLRITFQFFFNICLILILCGSYSLKIFSFRWVRM